MRHKFIGAGLIYELSVTRTNDIQLAMIGGASPTFQLKYDPFDWEYIPYVTQDIRIMRYPVRVLRTALRHIESWISGAGPRLFQLSRGNREAV